jgi:PAS domain S-box-containing protein
MRGLIEGSRDTDRKRDYQHQSTKAAAGPEVERITQFWSKTFDYMHDFVFLIDTEFRIVKANRAFEKAFKTSSGKLLGKKCYGIIHKTGRPTHNCPAKKLLRTRQVCTTQFYDQTLGMHIEVTLVPVMNRNHKMLGFLQTVRDITKQQEAKEELRKQKETAEKYFDLAANIMVALDSKGRIASINKKGQTILGHKERELIGKEWFSTCLPKNQQNQVRKVYDMIMQGKIRSLETYENTIITKKGEAGQILWHNTVLRDKKGIITGTLSSGTDITEQKKTQESLRQSIKREKMLADLVRDASVAITKGYPDGRLEIPNKAFCRLTGYSALELQKIDWNKRLTPPEWHKIESVALRRLHKTGKPVRYEKEYIRKDGSRVPIELFVNPEFETDGRIECYFAFITDITQRKKAEQTLKDSEYKWKTLVEIMPEYISILDRKHRFLFLNHYANGFSEKDVIGTPVYKYLSKESKNAFKKSIERAFRTKKVHTGEHTAMGDSGGMRHYEDYFVPITEKGKISSVMVISNDTTERKGAEKLLKESEKKLSEIVDGSPIATFVIDSSHKVAQWNTACEKLTGVPKSKVIGTQKAWSAFYAKKRPVLADLVLDKAQSKVMEGYYGKKLKKAATAEDGYETEAYFQNMKKTGRWLLFTAAPLKEAHGRITGVIETLQDITDLRETEQKFRTLYESSIDAIMTLEPPTWNFTSGNPATIRLFETKSEKRFTSCTPGDLSPKYQPDGMLSGEKAHAMISKAMNEGSNFFEWTHKTINGRDFAATVLLTKVKIAEREFLQATVRDITRQKKVEEEMDALASVVRSSTELINIATPDGKMTFLNEAGCKVLGIEPEDVHKHDLLDVIPEQWIPVVKEKIVPALLAGNRWQGDIQCINLKTKQLTDVHTITFPIIDQAQKKIRYFVNISIDITEQKKAIKQIKIRTDEIEKFNRLAVGRELRMIELKNRIRQLEATNATGANKKIGKTDAD